MKKADFERFSKILMATAEALDKDLSPQRMAIYFDDLFDLDVRAIEFAAKEHRKVSNFFPKVAELRDHARMWKPPALPGAKSKETKLLESPEITEERREHNKKMLQELIDSFDHLDANYGTDFGKTQDYEARKRELDRQAQEIRGEGAA